MKRKRIIGSQDKTGSMISLVNDYSEELKKHLETGQKKPYPQNFLDKYTKKAKKDELKIHLNLATHLTVYGVAQRQKAQEILRNDTKLIQESKQKFFDQLLKKSSGIL